VAGGGVVTGYVSGRSDDAFVGSDGRRWYRTGDLVRVDRDGRLVFLGRVDDQLNVGGVRIEPAEVESVLSSVDGIEEAVVVAASVDGRAALVAHVVGDQRTVSERDIRALLSERLPAGAVPRHIVFHEDLPRSAHGKLDRAQAATLPVGVTPGDGAGVGLGAVVDMWRRVLGRAELGEDDDFFEAGGDSVAAAELVTALGELVGADVPVGALLAAPTPRSIAGVLDLANGRDVDDSAVSIVNLRRGERGGPAVMMVAGWYDALSYRHLADAVPDDVAVGALVVADRESASPLLTVDDLVEASLGAVAGWVEDRSPSGLAVVGWSIGGVVAFELGQRLARSGRAVEAVALIDTYFPGEHRHTWSNRWWTYKSLLRPGSFGAAMEQLTKTGRRRLDRSLAALGRRLLAMAGEPVARPTVIRDTAGVPDTALDHRPAPGPVPVVLYAASTTNRRRTERPWRSVAPDLRVVTVEGRHRGHAWILGRDRVQAVADDLARIVASH
jgi:thioesterase domain-containing protein